MKIRVAGISECSMCIIKWNSNRVWCVDVCVYVYVLVVHMHVSFMYIYSYTYGRVSFEYKGCSRWSSSNYNEYVRTYLRMLA